MFTIAKIATFAAVAFGALVSAAAVPAAGIHTVTISPLNLTAIATNATGVTPNATLTPEVLGSDMSTILLNLQTALLPQVQLLSAMTAESATADSLEAIVQSMAGMIQSAVDAALILPDGAVGSGNVVVLLASILNLVLAPFGTLFNTSGVDSLALQPILLPLGAALAALVAVVLGLVGGVLVIVVGLLLGLLGPLLPVLIGLAAVLGPLLAILLL